MSLFNALQIFGNVLVVLVTFFIGSFILVKNFKTTINKWYVISNFWIGLWCICPIAINLIPEKYSLALTIQRICYAFGILLVPAFIHFVYTLRHKDGTKGAKVLLYGVTIVLLSFLPTPLFIKGLVTVKGSRLLQSLPGPIYYLFVLDILIGVGACLYMLFQAIKTSSGVARNQMKFVLIGYGIAYFGGVVYFSTIFRIINIFTPAGYIVSIGALVLFYAILKHRLMDIHIVIRWSIVVSMLAVVLTSLYVTGVVFVTKYLNMDIFGIRLLVIAFILGTLVLFHRTIKHMIEGVMLMREKDEKEELDELYQNLATTLDLKEIKWVVISELEAIFRTRCVTLVLFDLKERRFKVHASVGCEEIEKVYVAKESPLVVWLMNNNRPAVYDWLDAEREEDKKVQDVMDELNMEVAMVLAHNDTMVGMLGLAEKKRRRYTADEIVLFAEFCEKMAVPFTNAVKYRLNAGQDDEEDEQNEKLPSIPVPPNLNEPGKPKIYFRGIEVKDDPKDPFSVCIGPLHAVNRKWDWIKMRDRYDPSTKEIRLGEDEKRDGEDDGDDAS